ncbi:redox-sensing transcriptional repressor Rex [Clostridia bacterium]|nr:redox-sensing transcriptional repressor Rex [Clostridia bacterium]
MEVISIAVSISVQLYARTSKYREYLESLGDEVTNISATTIANALDYYDVSVRKDLSQISGSGRPKMGYEKKELLRDIKKFLGYDKQNSAIIVGVGHLGTALLSYQNFANCGLEIRAGFDVSPDILGKSVNGVMILDTSKLTDMCRRFGVTIGIITVPAEKAQTVCNELISGGVSGIWNFAPVTLKVPAGVAVKNEDLAASLSMLTGSMSLLKKTEE